MKYLNCARESDLYEDLLCDNCFDEQEAIDRCQELAKQKSENLTGSILQYQESEYKSLLSGRGFIKHCLKLPGDRKCSSELFWKHMDYGYWMKFGKLKKI